MKIIILGGNGFVGKNVTEVLKTSNHKINTQSRSNGLDLTNLRSINNVLEEIRPDIVVNCAALVGSLNYVTQIAADIVDINMRMLLNIYKAIIDVDKKIILINPIANCAFPGNLESYSEDKFWEGKVHQSVYAYGNTRRMIEVLSTCYKMQYGLDTINYFVPNMYGLYDSPDPNKAHALNALIGKVVKAQKENTNQFEVWGSGIAIREWLYAKDYARIINNVVNDLEKYTKKESVSIAQNYGLSVSELVEIIIEETEYEGKIIWNRGMPDGAPRKVMEDTRFRKLFPDFEFTSFRAGIRDTINYYKSIYPY